MRIDIRWYAGLFALLLGGPVWAGDGHDNAVFHVLQLRAEYGAGKDAAIGRWDLDGWIGGDDNKLWLKSEGDNAAGSMERVENWALYSRAISTFWDAQVGLRRDVQPEAESYAVFGFTGLAPYFFETEAHLFASEHGKVSARLREENDFLFTQKLILQPYLELNWFAQDVPEQQKAAGVSSGELGLRLRYEITREFAPYLDLRYEKAYGDTASLMARAGERTEDVSMTAGLQWLF